MEAIQDLKFQKRKTMAKQLESITIKLSKNEVRLLSRALYVTKKVNELYSTWISNELWETADEYSNKAFEALYKDIQTIEENIRKEEGLG